MTGDQRRPAGDRPLLRLDLATGAVVQAVHLGGEVSALARDGPRLIASVKPAGVGELGHRRLVALDWRSGVVLPLGGSHLSDTDARPVEGPVDQVVRAGDSLWALQVQPARLLQLEPSTLTPFPSIRLSSGRASGLAAGAGYVWVTATDAGEVLWIDPATGAVMRAHVGGSPAGIAVAGGDVWFADHSDGKVVRLDPRSLRPVGAPVRVGGKPTSLGVAGDSLFVTDESSGTVARIDVRSGRLLGPPIRFASPGSEAVAPTLASAGRSVWVSSFASHTLTRISSRSSVTPPSGELTVRGTGNGPVNPGPSGNGVINGGVAGTGHFTATGAITDSGTYIGHRRVRGQIATVRDVLVGKRGTITLVTTIHLGTESPAPWTITSGTERYAGLHGGGRVTVDNYQADPYTFVLQGTVSR